MGLGHMLIYSIPRKYTHAFPAYRSPAPTLDPMAPIDLLDVHLTLRTLLHIMNPFCPLDKQSVLFVLVHTGLPLLAGIPLVPFRVTGRTGRGEARRTSRRARIFGDAVYLRTIGRRTVSILVWMGLHIDGKRNLE